MPIKWNVRSSDYTVRSEQFGLPIGYGVGLPLMQPKLTSILERLEKAFYQGELGLSHIR